MKRNIPATSRGTASLAGGGFGWGRCGILVVLTSIFAFAETPAGPPLLRNGSFERLDAGGHPLYWRIDGKKALVCREQPAEGNVCLRLVDDSSTDSADAFSDRFPVSGGGMIQIQLWEVCEAGATEGLGVYLRLWDKYGKEMVSVREKQVARPTMQVGTWSEAAPGYRIPPEAAEAAVWLHTFSTAVVTCRVDDIRVSPLALPKPVPGKGWAGGRSVPSPDGHGRVTRWAHAESPVLAQRFFPPADWSRVGILELKLYSPAATGAGVTLVISSENPATDGIDYYAYPFSVDWKGWGKLVLPLRELRPTRKPLGWDHIDGISLNATGWGNTPDPKTVLLVKDIVLNPWGRFGPMMDDQAFFAALDLSHPGLEGISAAVAAGDWSRAKALYARYIRERKTPRWRIDWRDHPYRNVKVPPPEADNDPDSWDYYSRFLTVDWQGWKHFSLRKEDFRGRTFVEGKGWTGKNPIGWNWIAYIALNAKGWGLTPDPHTTLVFDDIQLRFADGATTTIADFESEDSGKYGGLERVAEPVRQGAAAGRWADMAQRPGLTFRNIPHDWTKATALEFWVYSDKATGARLVMVLDSDPPKRPQRAEDALAKRFSYSFGGSGKTWTAQFDGPIDWHANPTSGPARTHLWNESLHRHFHFRDLSQAYWNTGDERYAAGMLEQWLDWIRRNPPPLLSNGNGTSMTDCSFQTLTTGIRLESIWPDALYRCLGSPSFTDEAIVTIVKSVADQARHLQRWPTGGNWLTEESMGLFTAGMLFPEFREAATWRRTAIERLYRQLNEDVYPDGMEVELAAGYNNWVVSNFTALLERADMNGLRKEIPPDFLSRLEKMYRYQLLAMMPDGRIPGLNDSGNADVQRSLLKAAGLFPERRDFLFGATLGAKGTTPEALSIAFPYTGHYVMRSSWRPDAVYALFDAGPFGYGHQHEDKLHFVLYAYGRELLLDPGNYSYDRSPRRRYVTGTPGHNTVMVDGMGQYRRGRRETYVWPKPWDTPTPRGDDTLWLTSADLDFVRGFYHSGYGPRGAVRVTHRRDMIFVKPDYFLVVDTLTPKDAAAHGYEALFHLDAEEASLDPASLVVRSVAGNGQAYLRLVPWRVPGLTARIVKGQEDPVQGWANGPWRPIPTAIYRFEGTGVRHAAFVLEPVPPNQAEGRVREVQATTAGDRITLVVSRVDGRRDRIILAPPDAPGGPVLLQRGK